MSEYKKITPEEMWPPIKTEDVNNDETEPTEPFKSVKEGEAKMWADNALQFLDISNENPYFIIQQNILQEMYKQGKIENLLSPDNIKNTQEFPKNLSQEEASKQIPAIQIGIITEKIAEYQLSLDTDVKETDQYASSLILTLMQDLRLFPSFQKHSTDIEKLNRAVPDFIIVEKDKTGNAIIKTISEVKLSYKTAILAEEEKSQFSKFILFLKEIIKILNNDLAELQEKYGIDSPVSPGRKIKISPNLKKYLFLPSDQTHNKENLFDWKIHPLAFSHSDVYKLKNYLLENGFKIYQKYELDFKLKDSKETEDKSNFIKTLNNDLMVLEGIFGSEKFKPIDYYSLLMYQKIPQNEEQRNIFKKYEVKNKSRLTKKLFCFIKENAGGLLQISEKYKTSNYAYQLYCYFKNILYLAIIELQPVLQKEIESTLSGKEKEIWQEIPSRNLITILDILTKLKEKSEDEDKLTKRIKDLFYPTKSYEQVKEEIIDNILQNTSPIFDIAISELNKKKSIIEKFGLINKMQLLSVLFYNKIPLSDEQKKCFKQDFSWKSVIVEFTKYLQNLKVLKKHQQIRNIFQEQFFQFFPIEKLASCQFYNFMQFLRNYEEGQRILESWIENKEEFEKLPNISFIDLYKLYTSEEKPSKDIKNEKSEI